MQGLEIDLLATVEQQASGLVAAPTQQRARSAHAPVSYRQREPTKYRGVTKTSGTNSGIEKYDVQ